jgi:hypothetical protein
VNEYDLFIITFSLTKNLFGICLPVIYCSFLSNRNTGKATSKFVTKHFTEFSPYTGFDNELPLCYTVQLTSIGLLSM